MPYDHTTLSTALQQLNSLDPEQPVGFEDLVAMNAARDAVNELFASVVDELRENPESTPLWSAISTALELENTAGAPAARKRAASQQVSQSRETRRVSMFWSAFEAEFAWDFLPVAFLHELYSHWMQMRFPREVPVSRYALIKLLKAILEHSGGWGYTRSRPGSLMNAAEPLAEQLVGWDKPSSAAAIYGLRRSGV